MIEENDLEDILSHVLEKVEEAYGFMNLAAVHRLTGISRSRLRRWKENGFHIVRKRHGNGRVLLTLLFSACNLQLAYILEKKDTMHVCAVHRMLQKKLGYTMYRYLFGLILTDRGTEFSDPRSISIGPEGELYTEIYYCDPMNSNQKAHCERNHSEIRRVIPKGTDIVCSQEKIDFMMDNINSMPRPALGNKSAYEHFCFLHGKKAADALGLKKIPAEDVTLKPYILL